MFQLRPRSDGTAGRVRTHVHDASVTTPYVEAARGIAVRCLPEHDILPHHRRSLNTSLPSEVQNGDDLDLSRHSAPVHRPIHARHTREAGQFGLRLLPGTARPVAFATAAISMPDFVPSRNED